MDTNTSLGPMEAITEQMERLIKKSSSLQKEITDLEEQDLYGGTVFFKDNCMSIKRKTKDGYISEYVGANETLQEQAKKDLEVVNIRVERYKGLVKQRNCIDKDIAIFGKRLETLSKFVSGLVAKHDIEIEPKKKKKPATKKKRATKKK